MVIERDQAVSFGVNNLRRMYADDGQDEDWILELEVIEADWSLLGSFPNDAIGGLSLNWPDEGKSVAVALESFSRHHRNRRKLGELFLIRITTTQKHWLKLDDMPRGAVGEAGLVWTRRASEVKEAAKGKTTKRTAKPKEEKGPHGQLWRHLPTFLNRWDVREWLGLPTVGNHEDEARRILYGLFDVTSRTFISADRLIVTMRIAEKEKGITLAGAITAVRDAERKVLRIAERTAA